MVMATLTTLALMFIDVILTFILSSRTVRYFKMLARCKKLNLYRSVMKIKPNPTLGMSVAIHLTVSIPPFFITRFIFPFSTQCVPFFAYDLRCASFRVLHNVAPPSKTIIQISVPRSTYWKATVLSNADGRGINARGIFRTPLT